jgi:hypothetical protein
MIRRLAILELGGATEQAIEHATLSRVWSEAGTQGDAAPAGIHGSVEDTKLSTNKQHTLSHTE